MEAVGHPEHRYTLAILNGLYLVSSVPCILLMIFRKFYFVPSIVCCLCTLFGLLGCCILCQQDNKWMNIYRKILVGVVGLQILAFISTFVILIFRSYIAETFLNYLISDYHVDQSIRDVMDTIHVNFECCGLNSYKDWSNSLPHSCCSITIQLCTASTTKLLGCKENLSMFMLLICLAFLFVSTGNIILHAYCVRCAYELSKEYERIKETTY